MSNATTTPTLTKLQMQAAQAKLRFDAVMKMQDQSVGADGKSAIYSYAAVANRIGTGRRPSMGDGTGTGVANSVSHPPRRPSTGGMLKRINSQPAW
ncbi:hypothetical protein F503_08666 [Ophiostoma piceae UAMH 11346]|uniref:Uncharacterized protein n=1 Tax=Ophiostoma piceae (strain UAMH 11346) TaxID=1262450 RepID=S3BRK3_OPHP1|nr:hypothetical protein F503_08666 [Ophiostoma piceae UAMH 11346]